MEQMQTQEVISALADGQLAGEAFARGVDLAASDPLARRAWSTYHLIGDVLRSGELAVGSDPSAFVNRLQQRLREEQRVARVPPAANGAFVAPAREAANDTRWKILAGFASFAAVSAIAWNLAGPLAAKPQPAQLATGASGAVLAVGADRAVMIRDPQLDELLAAHRQLLGPSALQMSTGFVRNATFDARRR